MLNEVAGGFASDDGSAIPPLFRPEALAAAADNGLGRPIATLPLSWTMLSGMLALMAVAFATFLLAGSYTRKETAGGIVRSVGGETRVAVAAAGIVSEMKVVDGQRVRAGQTLLTIDTARSGVDGTPVDRVAVESLDRELSNLTDRLRAVDEAAAVERQGQPSKIIALQGERAAAVAQERAAVARLALARETLAKLEPVAAKGFISGDTMRRRQEEVIVLTQEIANARGALARLDGQIGELRTSVALRPMAQEQSRGQILDLIAQARREREAVARERGYAVTAPTDGVVTAVQVARGQRVDPQLTLMTISAPSDGVRAEIFVPSRAIGFLEPGQSVRVRYDAFPHQRFGSANGRIAAISSTVLRPQEVEAAIRIEEPVYRVVIALDRDSLTAYGHRYRIRPGFALSADILLDRRNFAQWLLDPVMALRGRL